MKILVIAMAGIGDALLATPLIRQLRRNFPDATLDALVRWPGSKDLLENNPHLNRVYQKNLIKESAAGALRFLRSLRKERYDVSINAHPQSRIHYRLIARVIGAPQRLSHIYECFGMLDRWLVNRTLAQDYTKHTIANNFALLPLIGAKPLPADNEMEVFLSPGEHDWAEAFMATHGLAQRRKLGVHVGSGSTKNLPLKRWPLRHYLELFQRLNRTHPDVSVLLFGGPDEEKDHQQIVAATDPKLVLPVGAKTFRQSAAMIQRCDAFLSVDTVLMHLAATVKVPRQMVIEAPTLNETNLPRGNPFTLIRNPVLAGRNLEYYRYDGSGIKGSREELLRCMASVSVEEVYRVLSETLP